MIRRLLLAAALLFLLTAPAYAGFESQSWRFSKDVRPPDDGFALIDLDQEILVNSRDDLADIRLSDKEGQEVPYQLVRQRQYKEETYQAQIIDNVIRVNEFSSVTLDLQEGNRLHNLVLLDLETKNDYLRDVKIEESDDNRNWSLVATGKVFFVSPNYRQNDLSYPTASSRYLKVSIDARGKEPLIIRSAKIKYVTPPGDLSELLLPSSLTTNRTDAKNNVTEIVLELGAKGYQAGHIDFQVSGSNYNRLVELYDSNDGNNWNSIGSDRIFQYKWIDYETLKNKLTINRRVGKYIKLVVDNQDSPPLDIISVSVWGDSPKILADLHTGGYTLWYGNPDSKLPQYDISQFSHLIDMKKLAVIQPDPESANMNYRPKITSNRWFLNIITIISALVIGLIILKNMKAKA
jgi:hypothetical protein